MNNIDQEEPKKPGRPIYKRWWFWVLAAIIIIAAIPSGGDDTAKTPENTAPAGTAAVSAAPTATQAPTPVPTPAIKTYGAGQYKTGVDIEAGEYVLLTDSMAYFEIAGDSTGKLESIIANDNFTNRSIITVSDGQYLKLTGCKMYAFTDAPAVEITGGILPQGMYKVGSDIEAGEYKVVPDGSGYVEVSSSSRHILTDIISNDILSGEQYITVNDGQYLKLSGAHLIVG